jgi:NAD(P)-dependent dehydrogenase (short-subunit alcohol dehydrogenase family)
MTTRLNNKVAVITGGNSGIGLATAQRFVEEGAKVVIFGRDKATLDRAVETLGANAFGVQGDVTNFADLDRLFGVVKDKFGRVDALFINAGVAQFAPIDQASPEHFDTIFNINVRGAYFTVQKALPLMGEGSSIVLTTSGASELGMAGASVYSATKAALRNLARTLSADLIGRGIRVNAVAPGPIETPIFNRLGLPAEHLDAAKQGFIAQVPAGRLGQPSEIAAAVAYLASDDAKYVVGIELPVDGGMTTI